jgi:hypothetical protein
VGDRPSSRAPAADDAGISPHQAKQAMRVAAVSAERFEDWIERDDPPTLTELAREGTRPKPAPDRWLRCRSPLRGATT